MILKIRNISIGSVIFRISVRCIILENNLSEKIQLEMNQTFPQKKTLKICFLTMCFDVNCSCVDANKATLCKTSANKTAPPRNSDTSLYCMGLRTKITETKNELEEQNINQCKQTEDVQDDDVFFSNVTNELYTQMRGILCRFHNRMICNRIFTVGSDPTLQRVDPN